MNILLIARRAVWAMCACITLQAPAQANSFLCTDQSKAGYVRTVETRDVLKAGTNAT